MNENLPVVIEGGMIVPVETVEAFEKRLDELRNFTKRNLHEGVDFGTIPGTPKPTLLKPGAEKLLRWNGLVVESHFLPDSRLDLKGDLLDATLEGTVISTQTGIRLGTLHANCNSEERRYKDARHPRWRCRDAKCGWKDNKEPEELVCPKCGGNIKRPQTLADQKNVIEKQVDKRLWVGAALLYTMASEAYTQDVEDMEIGEAEAPNGFPCPKCGKGMLRERKGSKGAFWGCSAYPACKHTQNEAPSEGAENPPPKADAPNIKPDSEVLKKLKSDLYDEVAAAHAEDHGVCVPRNPDGSLADEPDNATFNEHFALQGEIQDYWTALEELTGKWHPAHCWNSLSAFCAFKRQIKGLVIRDWKEPSLEEVTGYRDKIRTQWQDAVKAQESLNE